MVRDQQEIDYLRRRETESLRMAKDASEPYAATIHRRMAEQYASRVETIESSIAA